MTFKDDILEVANGESIESIVVGTFGWGGGDNSDEESFAFDENQNRKPIPRELKNTPISWDKIVDYLDYEYDRGYGSPECHAIYAYTVSRIIFVSAYDGATSVEWIPKNPVNCSPEMFGGG